MTHTHLAVESMTCGACVAHIKNALAVPGVVGIDVDLAARNVAIQHEASVSSGRLIELLGAAGYAAQPATASPPPTAKRSGCCCG